MSVLPLNSLWISPDKITKDKVFKILDTFSKIQQGQKLTFDAEHNITIDSGSSIWRTSANITNAFVGLIAPSWAKGRGINEMDYVVTVVATYYDKINCDPTDAQASLDFQKLLIKIHRAIYGLGILKETYQKEKKEENENKVQQAIKTFDEKIDKTEHARDYIQSYQDSSSSSSSAKNSGGLSAYLSWNWWV